MGYTPENHAFRLKSYLYGLKQSAREWYKEISSTLIDFGFVAGRTDECIFLLSTAHAQIYLNLYVDDIYILVIKGEDILDNIMNRLMAKYTMKSLGELQFGLGIRFNYTDNYKTLEIDQEAYIDKLCERFSVENAKKVGTPLQANVQPEELTEAGNLEPLPLGTPYRQLVGALLFCTRTRPDIEYATNRLSRMNHNPTKAAWKCAKRVLIYLKSTKHIKLRFNYNADANILDCFAIQTMLVKVMTENQSIDML